MSALKKIWQATAIAQLSAKGILGMNSRNISYISRYNARHLYPLVDDKLQTKELALEHGVNVPGLIDVIRSQHGIRDIKALSEKESGFCIKPAKGAGGKGILVISKSAEGALQKTNGQSISVSEIERHVSDILAGLFSLGGKPDVAMVETLIQVDDAFSAFTHEGVPDLRILVFRGVPTMAMMRLSCASSKGKANLHQGAVGVGIDIATGVAINAVQKGEIITHHPDTKQNLLALKAPQWRGMLELACACYDMTGLGYLGVDLVLDKVHGPLCLELNARPGLSIQIANNQGLLPRLRKIETLKRVERMSISDRIDYAASLSSCKEMDANTPGDRGGTGVYT